MSVPRGKVNTELKTVFFTGFCQLFYQIALAVSVSCCGYRVICICAGEQAESVMMLCCKNDTRAAGALKFFRPCIGVYVVQAENPGIYIAAAPFFFCEGVQPKMNEIIIAELLEIDLSSAWYNGCYFI